MSIKLKSLLKEDKKEVVKEDHNTPTFDEWFKENKSSSHLKDLYSEHQYEMKQMGMKIEPIKKWAVKIYDAVHGGI